VKFKKGDQIMVTIGKDRGKKGKIDAVFPKSQEVQVGGINLYKRHLKSRGQGKPGGIVDLPKPLEVSKVALVCPKCGLPTRVGFEVDKNKEKTRICKKCKNSF
jgi:large subunit ribosomal protein L24